MKKILTIMAALCALLSPQAARAQIYDPFETDFRGRLAVEADYKIVKGLHVSVSEEARVAENFTSFDRFMTTADISYKPFKYMKIGAGYTFLSMLDQVGEGQEKVNTWDLRHRAYADVTGMYKVAGWSFSLRERYQLTARTGDFNVFQNPALEHVLRTRLKVSYEFRKVPLEPYVAFEARTLLNGINTDLLARTNAEARREGYAATFDQKYFNRYRSQIGLEYKINSHNSFDFYILGDYWTDTKADTNAEGKLKKVNVLVDGRYQTYETIYYRKGFNTSAGIAYKFSF